MDVEASTNFSMLFVAIVASILFVILKSKKAASRKKLLLQSLGLGFLLFAVASLVAFFVYTDALNILAMWIIYLLAYIVSSLVNIAIIFLRKR